MPQLDAALAFTLTMLAVASMTTSVVAFLNSKSHLRRKQLARMVTELFEKKIVTAVERHLKRLEGVVSEETLADLHQEVRDSRAADESSPPHRDEGRGGENDAVSGSRFSDTADVRSLLQEIDARELVSLSADELKSWISESSLGRRWQQELGDHAEELLSAVVEEWNKLGAAYTEAFRSRARLLNTLVAGILALVFNIDSFYLLHVYLTDDDSRQAVLAANLDAPSPAPRAAQDSAQPEPNAAELRQELLAFQQSGFPIGWELFPSCPPTSADSRCVEYWQHALKGFDISRLSFSDRVAINPLPHIDIALTGRSLVGQATEQQQEFGGGLKLLTLLGWLAGLALTAILAGQGAPFWFELVQKLALTREAMRKSRGADSTRASPQVAVDSQ